MDPWRSTKASAPTPAEVTTWPTLKIDLANGRRLIAWAAMVTAANTSTDMEAGTRSRKRTRNPSSKSMASDSPPM